MDGPDVADGQTLESLLLSSLQRFIRTEGMEASSIPPPKEIIAPDGSSAVSVDDSKHDGSSVMSVDDAKSFEEAGRSEEDLEAEHEAMTVDELIFLQKAREAGVVYVLGDSDVNAKKDSWFFKKLVINYIYAFLRRNCRPNTLYLSIPKARLLKVGMEYDV